MTSKRLLDQPRAGDSTHEGGEPVTGKAFKTNALHEGALRNFGKEISPNGHYYTATRERHYIHKKFACGREEDEQSSGRVLKHGCPAHRLILNGIRLQDQTHMEAWSPVRGPGEPGCRLPSPETPHPHTSSIIPVPHDRRPSGLADKEVMAATVLTILSTSPLVLNPSSSASGADLAGKGWKESLSASYSSSTSGNWSWDASDQSVPSTPSPPLSNDAGKSFLLSSQSDDNIEETESTHFLFEDPIPRKRKNSMKVMFKCLWKNCEKVLSTSSGIQRHIRTVHLGRNGDSDYSDGEEDFYYSEIEVNMDTLSEGLSNLTPTSPTTSGPAPIFPVLTCDASRSEPAHMIHTPLSQSAPSTLCHIRTDHAYQATTPVSIPSMPSDPPHSEDRISVSWPTPPVIYKGLPGPMTQIRTVSIGEKRQPVNHTTVSKTHTTNTSTSKPTTGTRKPRGDAKKCRKVYGMEKRDLWCTACRWKKACQRFTD
ncbi:zinc finger protein 704-like isoform X1 [Sinocyclocheilus rhinocerous]|uniref:Zinc finger protein 704-like n=1 Tax=Sinocyclocheilus rhinocerous TaxID=307959 RepID=A0A673IM97_9TELE|nr:PREDICTED: zinc finger protein 704-like isoform X1 [Sinocyclocheilus rhinocerous]